MMPAKAECRLLTLALSLALVTTANAAPSLGERDVPLVANAWFPNINSSTVFVSTSDDVGNSELSRIGKELFQPPSDSAVSHSAPAANRSLPGVPAAVFMVLTGFVCVSFVNDRRIWLAGFAGLLWLGHTGLLAIPEVVFHIADKGHFKTQHGNSKTIGRHHSRTGYRLRSHIEGTHYMGLLRHLAGIPTLVSSSMPMTSLLQLSARPGNLFDLNSSVRCTHSKVSNVALLALSSSTVDLTVCSARAAEQSSYFSPGFIFPSLARGPPTAAWKDLFTPL
ncbi:MAG: hypothetical protein JW720_14975 [Sedimentisphaerales bacterium]|nr:hypothetical protein [Sedimentisphaerales bacterium]